MSSHRSVATILFTDIVGSTERAAELGDHGWRDLLARHHALVRQALHRYHGHEIATAGDGFLAVFDAAEWAILCGHAIRMGVQDLDLAVRCGIHMGEVERTPGGDLSGIAVHVGSRVSSQADAGEILVTGGVRDAELGSGFGFEDRGIHPLKGVPGEWRLWAVAEIPEGAEARVPEPEELQPDPPSGLWTRVKQARIVQVGAIYVLASWIVLQTTDLFIRSVGLPEWALPAAMVLLLIGLVVILATAWVQSRPETQLRAAAGELPRAGAVDVTGLRDAVARGKLPHLTWGRALLGGVVAFALVFGVAGLYVVIQDRGASFSPDPALAEVAPGIAVLPFTVQGEGLDVMREGMVSLLSTGLDGVGGVRAITPGTVYARWREQVPGEETPDLPTALAIARQTGAKYALIGSAVSIGSSMRVVADVYEVETGERLGQAQVEGTPDDVLPLVDRLGVEVLRVILQGEEELPEVNVAALTTESPEALRAYLGGEVHMRHFDIEAAIEAYTRAVEVDSTFALAQARLGHAYVWASSGDLGLQHLEQAARLADRLPAREATLVKAALDGTRRTTASLESLREAARRYPDDARVWHGLAETYAHVRSTRATPEEVERLFGRAVELDPRNAEYLLHYTEFPFWFSPDSARAADRLAMLERAAPSSAQLRGGRLALGLVFGDSATRAVTHGKLGSARYLDLRAALIYAFGIRSSSGFLIAHEIVERREDAVGVQWALRYLYRQNAWWRGRVREGLGYLDDPQFPDEYRALFTYAHVVWGLPIRNEAIEEALGPARIDSLAQEGVITLSGALAVDRSRWTDYDRARTELEGRAKRAFVEEDSIAGMMLAGMVTALNGYRLWKQGQPELALPLLEDDQAQRLWEVRWLWLPRLYTELGRYKDAERAYTSYGNYPADREPLIQRELGGVYEALGEYDKAVESYEYFVEYWKDADPELQPKVEETRQAILRLKPLRRQ